MTVAHKNLTGSDLHEPKGVAAAAADKVYVSDGAGSGAWQKIDADQLTGTGNPFGGQLLHIQHQETSGTESGTFTSGDWRTRTLNTSVTNEISGASLASNQTTLPAGTYFIQAAAVAYNVDSNKLAWYNVTDDATVIYSMSVESGVSTISNLATLSGRFTIAGTKVFELIHQCETTQADVGFGFPGSFGTEIYADVMIWKVA